MCHYGKEYVTTQKCLAPSADEWHSISNQDGNFQIVEFMWEQYVEFRGSMQPLADRVLVHEALHKKHSLWYIVTHMWFICVISSHFPFFMGTILHCRVGFFGVNYFICTSSKIRNNIISLDVQILVMAHNTE